MADLISQAPVTRRSLGPRRKFCGLLTRSERWHLSARAWLLLIAVIILSAVLVRLTAYPFLALNRPVSADVLVVEGWVHDFAIAGAVAEFRNGGYRTVFTTGGPVVGAGGYINDFNTYASVAAERLIAAGIPRDLVHIAPLRDGGRDRTYHSAVVLKQRLRDVSPPVTALNVVTENVHARRTLLLFKKALEPEINVGVIALGNPDYDPKCWWQYSEGVRDVIGESLAYVYAKLFFSPKSAPAAHAG